MLALAVLAAVVCGHSSAVGKAQRPFCSSALQLSHHAMPSALVEGGGAGGWLSSSRCWWVWKGQGCSIGISALP